MVATTPPTSAHDAPPDAVRWGLGDALAGLALTLVAPILVGGIVLAALGNPDVDDLSLTEVALLQVPLWLGMLGAPLWATHRKGRRSLAADFGLRMRWVDIPVGIGIGLASQIVIGNVFTRLYDLFGVDPEEVGQSAEALTDSARGSAVGVVLLFLVVGLGAPVFEELFWRGLWLGALSRRLGTVLAVVISSVLFAAVHFAPYDFPLLVCIGLVLAVLRVHFDRLGPAIWAHLAFNLLAVTALLAEA